MSLPETYRAWIWHSGQLPEGMKLEQRPLSQPQAGEVLIRNQAIGLNPVDWKLLNIKSGQVPGVDGAGTVVVIGSGVSADWLGQRVA
ncbi:alcohol dehydrogenase catalytic domain-containing protein [Entomohabitans teleogrylli]|uniref:alcohol dehydrogenase catalytic domain-containing protein n=1 Tax=Entomohabitans teleogrylli TaxID=1384589 RepID=UPI000A75B561|nr:alcohol dehydrogenase catalytic domain-containing protein [Entomohabitans teleogrylli]